MIIPGNWSEIAIAIVATNKQNVLWSILQSSTWSIYYLILLRPSARNENENVQNTSWYKENKT